MTIEEMVESLCDDVTDVTELQKRFQAVLHDIDEWGDVSENVLSRAVLTALSDACKRKKAILNL